MSELDLSALLDPKVTRLLMTIPLQPLQGDRFQPTGFPSLGAATYQTKTGTKLIVESPQSMANRLEKTCWDDATNKPVSILDGISHVTVNRDGKFLTDSMLEAHRLNSVYIEDSQGDFFTKTLPEAIAVNKSQPIDRRKVLDALLRYDVGSLIHGVFLESLDGRLRIARALSSFIEASNAQVAASGGAKVDRIRAGKEEGIDAAGGYGNVIFARDEFVGDIEVFVNLDVAQIRGYGFPDKVQRLLLLLSLYKVRKLINGDLRLRTACDLQIDDASPINIKPAAFSIPELTTLETSLTPAIAACKGLMNVTILSEGLPKAKKVKKAPAASADDSSVPGNDSEAAASDNIDKTTNDE